MEETTASAMPREVYGFAGFVGSAAAFALWAAFAYWPLLELLAGGSGGDVGGAVGEAGAADPLRTARYWALAPLAWAPVAVCFGAFVAYGALSQLACASVAGSSLAAADAHFRAPPECRPSPVLGEGDEKEAPTDVPAAADLPLHVANAFLYDGEGGEAEEESLWTVTTPGML